MRILSQTLKDKAESSKDGSFDKRYDFAKSHIQDYIELQLRDLISPHIERRPKIQ